MLLAPSEKEWYHGRMGRHQSEERLRATEKMGSYLGKTGINHFRITAVCGDFYIGGRQFDSLQDLI